ncbi:sister chromatid cohesion protein DCC1 [Copidosoma floridanum]|uniref:sister chromatid cohesion protein DCC1 n=1 Tax=Copidosoma floridanum TaxID=29053 RepID=UPI0006C9DBD3|nr:sister chromatid cohesion protein DCC1 [Copidosoma floridanum]
MESENKENFLEEPVLEDEADEELDSVMRTPEELEKILMLANIPSSEIATIIQTLYSSIPLDSQNSDYLVMEVDNNVLEAIKNGESLSFRGEENEPAVFCTNNITYEVKEAETSNTCLVVPGLKCLDQVNIEGAETKIVEKKEITLSYHKYLELKQCIPKLNKLQTILEPSSFKGLEYEKLLDPSCFYDWQKLRNEIQASDEEIKEALADNLIAELDGYYRLISFEFEARALGFMLDLIEENSWELDEIDKDASYESLDEIIPKPVFEVLFKKYAEPTKTKEDGTQLYRFNEAKSCKLLAHVLLSASRLNKYDDFMKAWNIGTPENFEPKEEYLYGVAIVRYNKQAMRKEVIFYPESSLPDDLIKRLDKLFNVKEKWTFPEIAPYLSKFETKNENVNTILMKYTRPSTYMGVQYYSAKHGK